MIITSTKIKDLRLPCFTHRCLNQDNIGIPYSPVYNAHFFSAEKAPKIDMRIIHGILCFRLTSFISICKQIQEI